MVKTIHWMEAMNKYFRIFVPVVIAILIGVSGGLVVNYYQMFKKVYVNVANNIEVNIYPDLGENDDQTYNYNPKTKPLFQLESSTTIKLKKGVYDFVVADESNIYENPISKVVIGDTTSNITVAPYYNDNKLGNLLIQYRPAIQQILESKYPNLTKLYKIDNDSLYENGEWYGADLVPLNPNIDELKVIMNFKNNIWVVAVEPQISISIPSNPTIPSDVIDSVDQL